MTEMNDNPFDNNQGTAALGSIVSSDHQALLNIIMHLFGQKNITKMVDNPKHLNKLHDLIDSKKTASQLLPSEIAYFNSEIVGQHRQPKSKEDVDELLTIDTDALNDLEPSKLELLLKGINSAINTTIEDLIKSIERKPVYSDKPYVINAYKVRPRSVWWGKGEEKLFIKFYHRLQSFNFENGGMFHVILKVYPERFTLQEANKAISAEHNLLIKNITRGKKSVVIIKRIAIKEWHTKNSYPHLHLFLEIENTPINVKKLIQQYWTIGDSEIKPVETEEHFRNVLKYCVYTPEIPSSLKKRPDKPRQFRLPKIFLDQKHVARVYYPQGQFDSKLSYARYKMFRREIAIEGINLLTKTYDKPDRRDFHNYSPKKKRIDPDAALVPKPKKSKRTYEERLAVDQSTINFKREGWERPIWLEMETSFRSITKIYGDYNSEKAYVIYMSDDNLKKLFEVEKLFRVKKALMEKAGISKPRP